MKILSFLNLSNREKPGCDSGVIFHRLLFERVVPFGHRVVIASPIDVDASGVEWEEFEVGRSKYDARFRFDWDGAASLIRRHDPDVVFVHQVELCANFRALLTTLGHKAKIVTYCHYWPVYHTDPLIWDDSLNHAGLARVILGRVVAAAEVADCFFVTSEWGRSTLLWSAAHFATSLDESRVHVLNCPADPLFMTDEPVKPAANRDILYNHRLYRQYGTEFLFEVIEALGDEYTFVITDFFSKRNSERKFLDPHISEYRQRLSRLRNVHIRDDGDIRSVYRNDIVPSARVGLAPFRINANWSMSAVDCMGVGVPVVAPSVGAFPEMIPSRLLFRDKAEAVGLLEALATDDIFYRSAADEAHTLARSFSADLVSQRFMSIVL